MPTKTEAKEFIAESWKLSKIDLKKKETRMNDRGALFLAPSPKKGAQSTQVHLFISSET
jgi:hypothetical protein